MRLPVVVFDLFIPPSLVSMCGLHTLTCSVWFSGLNVKVARFPQHFPDILLKEREQPADIFSTEAHQEGQIRTNNQRQQHFDASGCHTHVQVETLHTAGREESQL